MEGLGTALPTGAGFLALSTPNPAHVSSFSANGITTKFFAPETTSTSLPELNYVNQHFDDFTWVRDRQVPSVFDAQANELNVEVDRAAVKTSGSGTFYRCEGKKTDLTTVPGIANVLSIKADLYVDPAWRDLPATNGRKYNFGLWFTVPYQGRDLPGVEHRSGRSRHP